MGEETVYKVIPKFSDRSHMNADQYEVMYRQSIDDPDSFWAAQAEKFVTWFSPLKTVSSWDYYTGDIRWFEGAIVNTA